MIAAELTDLRALFTVDGAPGSVQAKISIVAAIIATAIGYSILSRGLSTRTEPSPAEVLIARTMRQLATPAAVRAQKNPVAPTPGVFADGLGHFADHCASCHANDGSGQTALGQNLFPKAPDMRAAETQSLSDGELFAINRKRHSLDGYAGVGRRHARKRCRQLGSGPFHPAPAEADAR